jgi:hypothetical protein
LLDAGADMAGAVAGSVLATIAGPPGIVVSGAGGVAVTRVLKAVGGAMFRRNLEQRQETRAGAAFGVAASRISARIMRGDQLRDDGFFYADDVQTTRRSPAEEILEGTLRAAAAEHEERKVPFLGAFWGNLAFAPEISRDSANFLLHLAERLTWRQFVLLAYASQLSDPQTRDLGAEFGTRRSLFERDPGVVGELDDLATLHLIAPPHRSDYARTHYGAQAALEPRSFGDDYVSPPESTSMGRDLHDLLALKDIALEDILAATEDLFGSRPP